MPSRPETKTRSANKRKPRRLGRPPGQLGEDTRRVILAAARECFVRQGFERATNTEIAVAANVTTAALYRHFESKSALYAAVVHEALADVIPKLRETMARQTSVRGAFRASIEVLDSLGEQQLGVARFLSSLPVEMQRHPQVAQLMVAEPGEVFTIITDLVETGVRAGEIARDKAQRVVSVMIASFMGISAYSGALGPSFSTHAVAGLVDLINGQLFGPEP
jgi:AcrR family transcriptional regulator